MQPWSTTMKSQTDIFRTPKVLLQYENVPIVRNCNYRDIPCSTFAINEQGMNAFNEVLQAIKDSPVKLNKIVRTLSGGISIEKKNFRPPMYDLRKLSSMIELTIVGFGRMWRLQFRSKIKGDNSNKLYGHTCFKIFRSTCAKFGIDIADYVIENGLEVKETIPRAPIKLYRRTFKDLIFEHAHHIDLNSSYMSGIAEKFTELREPIEYLYNNRKVIPEYKQVLVATWGFMQAKYIRGRYAHLSKAGVEYNNKMLEELTNNLREQGFTVLAYNTDGIWYVGRNRMYHDQNEGKGLGQWKHDHVDCTIQFKKAGAYQFIENGVVYTKLRGFTKLDNIKPRDEEGRGWDWGDIYNTTEITYIADLENFRIIKKEVSDEDSVLSDLFE